MSALALALAEQRKKLKPSAPEEKKEPPKPAARANPMMDLAA